MPIPKTEVMKNSGTIVVADDVQANIDLLTGLLVRDGYTVHAALDGGAARNWSGNSSRCVAVGVWTSSPEMSRIHSRAGMLP